MKLDTVEADKAEGQSVMQPWQGDSTVLIDRFDARFYFRCFIFQYSLNPPLSIIKALLFFLSVG